MKNGLQMAFMTVPNYVGSKLPSLLFLMLILLLSFHKLHATNYVSNASGAWTTTTIWTPNGTPGASDNVTIKGGTTVTIATAISCTSVTVDNAVAGATGITLNAGGSLAVSGDIIMNQPTSAVTNTLSIGAQTCTIGGNLTFSGTNTTASYISKVSVSTGSLTVTGAVSYAANTTAANQVITLTSTGSITFSSSLGMAYGTLSTTSTGTLNFNGSAPSFNLGGSGTPVFTTTNGGTINFASGFTNNTSAFTFAATSTEVFTGTGSITPNAAITFGYVKLTAGTTTLAGNITVAGTGATAWVNNGGTLSGTSADTLFFTGAAPTIGGTSATAFPVIQVGTAASAGVAIAMSTANLCAGLYFYGGATAKTFTLAATLTVNGNVTINQPTAAVTNNLLINASTCTISGGLSLPGTTTTAAYIAKVTVTTGSLTVGGTLSYGNNATAANAVITATTGTLTFSSPVTMASGTLSLSSTGNIYFNGSAPSLTYGGANSPVLSNVAGSNIYFASGVSNSSPLTFNATGYTNFTGTGTITTSTALTLGYVVLASGSATTVAGNFTVASTGGNTWKNNGGTMIATSADTVFFTGAAPTIATGTTAFPVIQIGTAASAAVAVAMSVSSSCAGLYFYGGATANTFTLAAATTLTVNGNVTINQPTAAVTNNLLVNASTCSITGGLSLPGIATTANEIAKVTVTTGSLTVGGTVSYGSNTVAANAVITASTGTLTFNSPVTMASGTLSLTGAGNIYFNGSAPSFTFGGANAPVFTPLALCNIYFANGFTNNTTAFTFPATSYANFTGTGTIIPTAAITFGYVNLATGSTTTLAGNITVASTGALAWVNNGGTLSGGANTVFFTGAAPAIGGTASTAFPTLQVSTAALAAAVSLTVNKSATATNVIMVANGQSNTFTITAGDTLTVSNTTINQPTAAKTNNFAINGVVVINGNLSLPGTTATAGEIASVSVGNSPAALTVTGAVTYGSNTVAADALIQVASGTITFGSSVTMASGTLKYTAAGKIYFNGTTAPSFTFGGANAPVFTTFAACNMYFAAGFSNNTTALVLNASSVSNLTGTGTITPTAAITFGTVALASGSATTLAGNIIVAGTGASAWVNNGGTLSGGAYTVYFTGAAPTIGGTSSTSFPTLEVNNASAGAVAVTMSNSNSCTAFTLFAGTTANTFTINSGDTLTCSGNATINQPTGAVTNSLAINGTCNISGNLSLPGAANNAGRIAQVTVGASPASLTVTGSTTFGSQSTAANALITTFTGTITFGTSVTQASGTISFTGAGTINFNGAAAPSLSFGGANAPVFTSFASSNTNFAKGLTAATTAFTCVAASTQTITGNGTVTPTSAITFGSLVVNSGSTLTAAGNFNVVGNWTDNGTFTPATYTVTFNGAAAATQTISNSSGETFYKLTQSEGSASSILQLNNNVTVTNTLAMTLGSINLNGNTLQLGNGAGATLTHAGNGTAYGGTFKRYLPSATSISSTVAPLYGLFPIGISGGVAADYDPVSINSTANATTGGYVSAIFNNGAVAIPVTYTDNIGHTIQAIGAMNSTLTTSALAGGTYNISCAYNGFTTAGSTTNLFLETYTGTTMGSAGTTPATTGTTGAPTAYRSGLTAAQLGNVFVIGTNSIASTPLYYFYYSRTNGNWSSSTTWSYTSGGSGASCSCTPPANANVTISSGQTVTVDVSSSPDYLTISNGATISNNSGITFTVNQTATVTGTGQISNSGTCNFTGTTNFSGTSTYTGTGNTTFSSTVTMPTGSSFTQTSATLTLAADAAINGTITLGSSGALALTGAGNNLSGTGSVLTTGGGTVTITNGKNIPAGGKLTFGNVANPLSVTLNGAQTITNYDTVVINGSLIGTVGGATFTNENGGVLEVTGNLLTTGTLSAETPYNTIVLNGNGSQNFNPSTLGFSNLTIASGGTKTLGGNSTVAHILTIQDSAILDESTYLLTGTANLTMTGSSELKLQRSVSGSYPEFSGVSLLGSGTSVILNQTAGTASLPATSYYNLICNGTASYDLSSVSTITGSLDISGSASIANNAVLKITDSLNYNSSATSTLANSLTVGTFAQSAGTFNDGGNSITVKGASLMNNGGTFNSTGSVTFKGSSTQTIGGTTGTTFSSLVINNSKGLTLAQPVTISNQLGLTSGIITTSSGALLTMLPGTTYTGSSGTSFISGPMVKIGSDNFIFPLGKGGYFGQAAISGLSSVATQVEAEYFHNGFTDQTDIASTLTGIGKDEYWTIERTVTTDSMQIQLFWQSAAQSGIMDCDYVTVAHYTGGQWINEQGTAVAGSDCLGEGSGSVQTNGFVSTFSPFTFGGSGGMALPIQLISFNATPNNNSVVLTKWVTQMEINNAFFTVERSADGNNFDAIGTVKGAGNSTATLNYEFTDEEPIKGVSYYRLRQTDFNGNSSLSDVVPVSLVQYAPSVVTVYPNPAHSQVSVHVTKPQGQILVKIVDAAGWEVYAKTLTPGADDSDQTINITTAILAPGVYMVSTYTGNTVSTTKLIIE